MSEPLGDKRKRLDNLLQSTVEEHNQQADELLGVFQRDFPRTYRLLDGPHFQQPARFFLVLLIPAIAGRLAAAEEPDSGNYVIRGADSLCRWLEGQCVAVVEANQGHVERYVRQHTRLPDIRYAQGRLSSPTDFGQRPRE